MDEKKFAIYVVYGGLAQKLKGGFKDEKAANKEFDTVIRDLLKEGGILSDILHGSREMKSFTPLTSISRLFVGEDSEDN